MKKKIIVLLLFVSIFNLNSQNLNYKVMISDPNLYKKTIVGLDLFNSDLYLGATLGYGVKLETQVSKFCPYLSYKGSYLDLSNSSSANVRPADGLKNQRIIEIGTTFFFGDNVRDATVPVTLSSSSSSYSKHGSTYTTTKTKYINVESKLKRMVGLDLGVMLTNRTMNIDQKLGENNGMNPYWAYQQAGSTTKIPIHEPGYTGTDPQPSGSFWTPATTYGSTTIFLGLRTRKVIHTLANIEGHGDKWNRSVNDLYFRLLYAPTPTLATMVDDQGAQWDLVPNQEKMFRNLGWVIGISGRTFNFFQMSAEIGYKPGPKLETKGFMDSGFYMGIGFGVFFGSQKGFFLKDQQ